MKSWIKQRYHWVVISLVLLEMIVYGGILNSFSVFTIPLCDSLGISRGDFSLAMMPYNIVSFFSTMFSGVVTKRLGYKRGSVIFLLLAAGSTVVMGLAGSPAVLTVARMVFAFSYGICFTAGAVMIVRNWFWKHQGFILGLVTMGSGIGGSLMTSLLTIVMERFDWRTAFFVKAGLLILVAVGYLLLLRERPEEMGLKTYGFGEISTAKKQQRRENDWNWQGYGLKEQLRRPSMYLMCFCLLISITCTYVTSSVMVPFFRDLHYSPTEAAAYQSVLMLALAVAKLLSGSMGDKFGAKCVAVICIVCAILGQGILSYTNDPMLNYGAVVIFSAGMCITSSVVPMLSLALFGYKGSSECNGIFLSMSPFAAMCAMLISNYGYDHFGSYIPIFRGAMWIHLGTLALFFLLFAMTGKDKARFLAEHGE